MIVRSYLDDESEHRELRARLLRGPDPVVSSELARIEFARAITSAARAGRISNRTKLLERFDSDCGTGGPIRLIVFEGHLVLDEAYELVLRHRIRTLDALHLAAATIERNRGPQGNMAFVTRDDDQAEAARAEGFEVI